MTFCGQQISITLQKLCINVHLSGENNAQKDELKALKTLTKQ